MLNVFPIQFLAPLAYMILRVIIGLLLVRKGFSFRHIPTGPARALALVYVVVGTLFVIGLYTQIAALLTVVLAVGSLSPSLARKLVLPFPRSTALLMLAISCALFITGAGPFAFDLPI